MSQLFKAILKKYRYNLPWGRLSFLIKEYLKCKFFNFTKYLMREGVDCSYCKVKLNKKLKFKVILLPEDDLAFLEDGIEVYAYSEFCDFKISGCGRTLERILEEMKDDISWFYDNNSESGVKSLFYRYYVST